MEHEKQFDELIKRKQVHQTALRYARLRLIEIQIKEEMSWEGYQNHRCKAERYGEQPQKKKTYVCASSNQ